MEDIVKYTKSHRLIWHGHVEGMLNQRKSERVESFTMEGTRKTGRPHKRRRDGGRRGSKFSGTKKEARNGQRPSGMEEDCAGSRGPPQQTVALEKGRKKKMLMTKKTGRRRS